MRHHTIKQRGATPLPSEPRISNLMRVPDAYLQDLQLEDAFYAQIDEDLTRYAAELGDVLGDLDDAVADALNWADA